MTKTRKSKNEGGEFKHLTWAQQQKMVKEYYKPGTENYLEALIWWPRTTEDLNAIGLTIEDYLYVVRIERSFNYGNKEHCLLRGDEKVKDFFEKHGFVITPVKVGDITKWKVSCVDTEETE